MKKVLTADRKKSLPPTEKTPYRMMAKSSYRAQGREQFVPAATVVSAFGYKAYNPLEEAARKYCGSVQVVGCAVKAGNALTAIREGYEAALAL